MAAEYAGDVTSVEAWKALASDEGALLLDVRTMAEWNFVGLPDLSTLERRAATVEWQRFPGGEVNAAFVADAAAWAGEDKERAIYCLCRSGARSAAAARALTAAGYTRVFNIADGFEGPLDEENHRGRSAGWKAAGLPWRQG
ncbi:MAG: rhodanese-like domain-containing protein [Hyphomicrobiaceae bacterium]|nr:rhodanese-like domain-containing protein [Hyphomicrobiaceae bacterium]